MEYRSLGRTGVQVSPLCLGCMNFGRKTSEAEAMDIVDHALGAGINFVDTANAYNGGLSEEAVGKALRRNGQRDRVVLATKFFAPMADDDPDGSKPAGAAGQRQGHTCGSGLASGQSDLGPGGTCAY